MPARMSLEPGQTFGRWIVLGGPEMVAGRSHYRCRCQCGTERLIGGSYLVNGSSRSCGCSRAETNTLRCRKHGDACGHGRLIRARLYRIWQAMIGRCHRPRHRAYPNYGGRGIAVCPEWRTSYVTFRRWARRHGYADDKSIDRIDNDGDYEPGNCRWADRVTQNNNRRDSRWLTAWGETKTLHDWSRDPRCRVSFDCLMGRFGLGWAAKDALTKPSRKRPRRLVAAFGETKPIFAWSKDHRARVSYSAIAYRLNKGWEPEAAITTPLRPDQL